MGQGYGKLQPKVKTKEELLAAQAAAEKEYAAKGPVETSKERMEREVREESARRKARTVPDQPSPPPVDPTPKPAYTKPGASIEDPDEKLIQDELKSLQKARGYKKLVP